MAHNLIRSLRFQSAGLCEKIYSLTNPLENTPSQASCLTRRKRRTERFQRLFGEQISIHKHDLSWKTHNVVFYDCLSAIYIANEHDVHKNIPNFGFSKSPCHLAFFCSATNTHTQKQQQHCHHPPHPLSLVTPKFPLNSSHEYANRAFLRQMCVMFLKEQI